MLMVAHAVFHGTQAEGIALAAAIARNCTCEHDAETGAYISVCEVHRALVEDQQWLDRLVFLRRINRRLSRSEWTMS